MGKYFSKSHTFLNKITTFVLMITLTLGTTKGRTLINSIIHKLRLLDKTVKIGFKVFLYVSVLLILFVIKKLMFG